MNMCWQDQGRPISLFIQRLLLGQYSECVPLANSQHLYILRNSKVMSMLHRCSVGEFRVKNSTSCLVEILQLRAKFQITMVSRFIWITNFSDRRRDSNANFLHAKHLPSPLGHEVYRLGGFGVPEFATLRQQQLIYVEILQLRAKFTHTFLAIFAVFHPKICVLSISFLF